jgi:hypothetical protein
MLKFLLPILFPSWRFFSGIGPSPRFDLGFFRQGDADPQNWIDMNQLPEKIDLKQGLLRLFHNPVWNDRLYMNTCAEHLFDVNSDFREQEIASRLLHLYQVYGFQLPDDPDSFCYRIRVVESNCLRSTERTIFYSRGFLIKDWIK